MMQAVRRGGSLLAVVLLARRAGVHVAGAVFLSIAMATVVAPVVNRGLSQTLLRMVPSLDPSHGSSGGALLISAQRRVLYGAMGIVILTFALEWSISPAGPLVWTFGAAMGGAVSAADLAANYLRAIGRRVQPEFAEAAVPVMFAGGLILIDPAQLGIAGLLWFRLGLEIAAAILLAAMSWSRPLVGSRVVTESLVRLRSSDYGPLWLTMLAWLTLGQFDVLVLGLSRDQTAVGIYVPVLRTCELLIFPYVVLNPYITAASAHAKAHLNQQSIEALYRRVVTFALLLTAPAAGALLAQPAAVIGTVYDISGPRVAPVARILVVGLLVFMWVGAAPAVSYGIGAGRAITRAAVQVIAVMIVTTSIGVSVAGVVGAACATAVSMMMMGTATYRVVRKTGLRLAARMLLPLPLSIALVGLASSHLTLGSQLTDAVGASLLTVGSALSVYGWLRRRSLEPVS